jgi:hypothetical protein
MRGSRDCSFSIPGKRGTCSRGFTISLPIPVTIHLPFPRCLSRSIAFPCSRVERSPLEMIGRFLEESSGSMSRPSEELREISGVMRHLLGADRMPGWCLSTAASCSSRPLSGRVRFACGLAHLEEPHRRLIPAFGRTPVHQASPTVSAMSVEPIPTERTMIASPVVASGPRPTSPSPSQPRYPVGDSAGFKHAAHGPVVVRSTSSAAAGPLHADGRPVTERSVILLYEDRIRSLEGEVATLKASLQGRDQRLEGLQARVESTRRSGKAADASHAGGVAPKSRSPKARPAAESSSRGPKAGASKPGRAAVGQAAKGSKVSSSSRPASAALRRPALEAAKSPTHRRARARKEAQAQAQPGGDRKRADVSVYLPEARKRQVKPQNRPPAQASAATPVKVSCFRPRS